MPTPSSSSSLELRAGGAAALAAVAAVALVALVSCRAPNPASTRFPVLAREPERTPVPRPTKVIGVMRNYPPADPSVSQPLPGFFVRSVSALASHGDVLPLHEAYDRVLYEGELVIVIGKRAHRVTPREAASCILGYTCGMDGSPVVTTPAGEPDLAASLFGKSADGVAPVGPYVVTGIDPRRQRIELRVNGEVVEQCFTRDLVWGPERLVSEISRTVTLEPGDLIFSGASRAVDGFHPGDTVEVEISDVGILICHVEGEPGKRPQEPARSTDR